MDSDEELTVEEDTPENLAFFDRLEDLVRRDRYLGYALNERVLGDIPFVHWVLKRAIERHHMEIVRHIVDAARIPIVPLEGEHGRTAIHLAYDREFYQACELMLYRCDDATNHTDPDGLTHLHVACHIGYVDAARRYLESGVDPNLQLFRWSRRAARSPLHIAVLQLQPEIVELLLEKGADVNLLDDSTGRTAVHRLCAMIAFGAENRQLYLVNPSIYARAKATWLRLLETLCEHESVDLNTRDNEGLTPVATLMFNSSELSKLHHDALELLLMNGADPRGAFKPCNLTALHGAVWAHRDFGDKAKYNRELSHELCADLVQMLAIYGADVEARDRFGRSVLEMAVSAIDLDTVRVLLDRGARPLSSQVEFKLGYFEDMWHFLPSLEMIERLLAILRLFESYDLEFKTSREADLRLLEFLYRMQQVYNRDSFRNILELGNENVLYDAIKLVPNGRDGWDRHSDVRQYIRLKSELELLVRHEKAIRVGQLYLSESTKWALVCATDHLKNHMKESFEGYDKIVTSYRSKDCWSEEDLLEDFKYAASLELDDETSLLDLMRASPHRMALRFRDFGFEYFLLSKKFALIDGLVRGYISKVLVRGFMTRMARKYLAMLLERGDMPEEVDVAFKYLNNDDLIKFIVAGMYLEPLMMRLKEQADRDRREREERSRQERLEARAWRRALKITEQANEIAARATGQAMKHLIIGDETNKSYGAESQRVHDEENKGEKNECSGVHEPKRETSDSHATDGQSNENNKNDVSKGDKSRIDTDEKLKSKSDETDHEAEKEMNKSIDVNGKNKEIEGEKNKNDKNDPEEAETKL
ncbi:uncharacterized protein LOC106656238 [Trichogramma pretiosum]|uniref:uncharacterized protein LOC106656238 n=1 Tax=Trichogramma pretiosum TaxID=7493 RepID=UPI0006C9E442|nr:uncharacterized protein LOC106656238 [Trichogramma pretiosum]